MADEKTQKVEKKGDTFFKDFQGIMMEAKSLTKDADNPFYKSKYVQLKDVLEEAKRVCLVNNFILYQRTYIEYSEGGVESKTIVETTLRHNSGEIIISRMPIVAKDYNDPQKVGAGLTYMRRYSLTCLLGIEEDDDDGNEASKGKPVQDKKMTTEQVVGQVRKIKDKTTLEEMKKKVKASTLYTEIQKNVIELAIEETLKKCE